ncbi:MAG: HD domain-containing phosphohydrolase, partial [Gammaproteobacteria bacterium]
HVFGEPVDAGFSLTSVESTEICARGVGPDGPFPESLARVTEYAGGHHEKMDGTGYPLGLSKNELSLPARIMAIADIYEALTASDRPYKKAKTLTESLKIMSFMVKDKHIDEDLFRLFLNSGVYQQYAERFLDPSQIDEVDINDYLTA